MFEAPNPELDEALELARTNPEQAAQVLRIAATYLAKQEKLPSSLAYFLADAFERSMKKASMVRGDELLINLYLKARNRRESANYEHVGVGFDELLALDVPRAFAIDQLAKKYGVHERTVEKMIAKYRANQELEASISIEEQRSYAQQSLSERIEKK